MTSNKRTYIKTLITNIMIAVNIFIALVTMKYVYLVYIHLSINNIVVMIKSGPIGAETVPSMGEVFFNSLQANPN